MDSRKMVSMTLHARKQSLHRREEETFRLSGRRRWDDLRKQHWSIYITVCKTDNQHEFDIRHGAPKSGRMGWGGRWERRFRMKGTHASVQLLSRVRLFANPWIAAHQASLSITSSRCLLKLMSIDSVMPSSHLILCRPLLLLPPIPPSIRVFSSESILHMRCIPIHNGVQQKPSQYCKAIIFQLKYFKKSGCSPVYKKI